jgi:ethylmalonyl-CoA/methylmalonyl-CoA decarboxylase
VAASIPTSWQVTMADPLDALRTLRAQLGEHAQGDGRVHLRLEEGVAHLVLDHGQRRNALTVGMMGQLASYVAELEQWDGALVVLSAAEPTVFCAGGDLTELPHAPPEAPRVMAVAMSEVLDALLRLPCVSVAALDGLAVGGGAELTTACDHRVGTGRAAIHFVQGRLGIAAGWGGSHRLVQHIGRRAALRVLGEARPVSVVEGLQLGLFDAVVPDADAVQGALAWLSSLRKMAPEAVRALKRQVLAACPPRQGHAEADAFADVWGGPAHLRALADLQRHQR